MTQSRNFQFPDPTMSRIRFRSFLAHFSSSLTLSRKFAAFDGFLGAIGGTVRFVETAVAKTQAAPANYKVSESLRSTHGQDGAVVLDVAQGHLFSLNHVGSRMLELMKSGAAESEIVEVISQEFEANGETVKKDLREFRATLQGHNLIDPATGDRTGLSISGV